MGIRVLRLSLLWLILVWKSVVLSQTSGSSDYYWVDGDEKIELQMIPDHIVDLSPPGTPGGAAGKAFKPISETKFAGGVRIFKLNKNDFNNIVQKRVKSVNSSPLFRQGGDVKALAGGVFLTFKEGLHESAIQAWCDHLGLSVRQKYLVPGQAEKWLIDAPVGLDSLSLANSLLQNHKDILTGARPNFWQALDTRELKKVLSFMPAKDIKATVKKTNLIKSPRAGLR